MSTSPTYPQPGRTYSIGLQDDSNPPKYLCAYASYVTVSPETPDHKIWWICDKRDGCLVFTNTQRMESSTVHLSHAIFTPPSDLPSRQRPVSTRIYAHFLDRMRGRPWSHIIAREDQKWVVVPGTGDVDGAVELRLPVITQARPIENFQAGVNLAAHTHLYGVDVEVQGDVWRPIIARPEQQPAQWFFEERPEALDDDEAE